MTYRRTDTPSYRDARTHIKTTPLDHQPNLHHAVPPVVGSLDVLDVVDVVKGGDERRLERTRVGAGALPAEAVRVVGDE